MRSVNLIILANQHNGKNKLISLVEAIEYFIASDGDRVCTFNSPLYFYLKPAIPILGIKNVLPVLQSW